MVTPAPPAPGNITPHNPMVPVGGNITLTHTNSSGVTHRQWQISTNNGATWTNVGFNSTSFNTGTLNTPGTFRYRVRINNQDLFSAETMIRVEPDSTDFAGRMNFIFQHVDRSRVTTGLLSDFGLQLVIPYYFSGVPHDSNFVNMETPNNSRVSPIANRNR